MRLAVLNHGSDGIPDRVFFHDIRGANININSQIAFTQRTGQPGRFRSAATASALLTRLTTASGCSAPTGNRWSRRRAPVSAGGPIGSFIGGNGPTNREGADPTVFPRQDRYNFNILAHYAFSDAFELFLEAKFVRVDTIGQNPGPAFIQGSTLDGFRERVRLDNPFLTRPSGRRSPTCCSPTIRGPGFRPRSALR